MADKPAVSTEIHRFGNEQIEVSFRKARPIDDPEGGYPGFSPGVTVEDGILCEYDVAVPLRDGTIIYTDIFRPESAATAPAIIAWSPYGKRRGWWNDVFFPMCGAVPEGAVSPMAKFEGPDPAYWCRYGYAVINPDTRCVGKSEGDLLRFCTAEGKDCHDLIEWVAAREWCSGKVGMSGNSWLAIAQWYTAAEQPPHLAAIAPWEGVSDYYRDALFVGGIPSGFDEWFTTHFWGSGRIEDVPAMVKKYPLMNGYWEDKIGRFQDIHVPAYVVASWTNALHSTGTFRGFRGISSREKWLRVHNTHEWFDYYTPEGLEDLRRFFDRYLKGIRNGWEYIPRVRLSVLDPGGTDVINRPEKEFPLARTQYTQLFLDGATGTLSPNPAAKESLVRYRADDDKGQASFTVRFDKDTELTGYAKLRLWVEADGSDDMDLFVVVEKLDEEREVLPAYVLARLAPAAWGQLRVSHRELDEAKSTPSEPYLTHAREQLLKAGEIVPVEIGLWPMGMLWHKGQQLRVVVTGHRLSESTHDFEEFKLRNQGNHIIHTGGKYDSHLLVPVIPR
jgi:uncharacterized protein